MTARRWESIKVIADTYGVCETTIRRKIDAGKIKVVRIGRKIKVDSIDLASKLEKEGRI